MPNEAMLPCPNGCNTYFLSVQEDNGLWFGLCSSCGWSGPTGLDAPSAIEIWNRRIGPTQPLAAIAMREAAAGWHDAQIAQLQKQIAWNDERSARLGLSAWRGNAVCNDAIAVHREAAKAIRAIPLPEAAQIIAAALAVPEVARLVEAVKRSFEGWANAIELGLIPERHRNTAMILRDDALAALKGAAE